MNEEVLNDKKNNSNTPPLTKMLFKFNVKTPSKAEKNKKFENIELKFISAILLLKNGNDKNIRAIKKASLFEQKSNLKNIL